MKRRRNLASLAAAVEQARTKSDRAAACFELALFHDNNSREAEAIPHYRCALELGLDGEVRAQALAWLASSLYKTGRPRLALESLADARALTREAPLRKFLDRLERRIRRA